MNAIHLEPAQVPATLRGDYSGKHFKAEVATSVTVPSYAGNWDGGSRDTYRLISVATGEAVEASDNSSAPWDRSRKDRTIELKAGYAVIRHTIFCGKDLGLTFYVHPENVAQLLPPPNTDELTAHEKVVICLVVSLISRARRDEAKRHGINAAAYDAAIASLKTKGLLSSNGGATPKGHNVAGTLPRVY